MTGGVDWRRGGRHDGGDGWRSARQQFGGGPDHDGWYSEQAQGGHEAHAREGQRRGRSGTGRESSFNGGRFDSDFDSDRPPDQRGQHGRRPWDDDGSGEGWYGRDRWSGGDAGRRGLSDGHRQFSVGQGYDQPGRDHDGYAGQPVSWSYSENWFALGPHTGRGPRGYQRSDDSIYEDVCERLSEHGEIDASDVEVEVSNGEVTLRGTVDHRQTKRLAEDAIEDVSGVRDVHNQLRVRAGQSPSFLPSTGALDGGDQTEWSGRPGQIDGSSVLASNEVVGSAGETVEPAATRLGHV